MNGLNRLLAVAIAAAIGVPLAAAANPPLANPSFEIVGPGGSPTFHSPPTPGGAGISAADSWGVFHNTVPATTATELVASTLPGGGARMIHVEADRDRNGINQVTGPPGSGPANGVASAWVFVNSGVVGMGSGDHGSTGMDVFTTTTGAWEFLQAPNGASPFNTLLFFASGGPADFYVEETGLRELQEIGAVRVEYSNLPDEQAIPGGGDHGASDPGQVLYTEPIDLPTDSNPRDVVDFFPAVESGEEPDAQVDALANGGDAGLFDIVANTAGLLVSIEGDPGGLFPVAAFEERPDGSTDIAYTQRDFNAVGIYLDVDDVDALELWGEPEDAADDASDADYFSLEGDANGVSVWSYLTGTRLPYIAQLDLGNAVLSLGFEGSPDEADLDALMVFDASVEGEWDEGDAILFSIRATNNWHGGEIVHWRFAHPPSFLRHGGHAWDSSFGLSPSFPVDTNEVDAIELPEPGGLAGLLCGGLGLIALARRRGLSSRA